MPVLRHSRTKLHASLRRAAGEGEQQDASTREKMPAANLPPFPADLAMGGISLKNLQFPQPKSNSSATDVGECQ